MASRKYKRSKNKPIFSDKKSSGNSLLGIVIMIVLATVMVFVGYSVGKPIMEFISNRDKSVSDGDDIPPIVNNSVEEPNVSEEPVVAEEVSMPVEEAEPEPIAVKSNIFFVAYSPDEVLPYSEYVSQKIKLASEKNYAGICIELVAEGGTVLYSTSNETAIAAEAVLSGGIDLKKTADEINSVGLVPYARISALSDHLVSQYDKNLSYMIEGTTTRWLDNSVANGGKPWLSPFAEGSSEYIGGLAKEISDAGFVGLIAGEMEFPTFRQRDLDYIGSSVKSNDRYKALTAFAEKVFNSFGTAKEFYIEVDAQDIISGRAEILSSPSGLCTKNLCVRFDPSLIGQRLKRSNGTEVSFEGLSEPYMLKAVFRLVRDTLYDDIRIVPLVPGFNMSEAMTSALSDMGYSEYAVCE